MCLIAAVVSGNLRSVQLLLAHGANPDARNGAGATPLWMAAQTGVVDVIDALVAAGADIEAKDVNGVTPLNKASQKNYAAVCSALMAAGADAETKANDGIFPLMWAADSGDVKLIDVLLAAGANTETRDNNGFTSLCSAAQNGHANAVSTLLTAGADVDAKTAVDGATPLFLATQGGHTGLTSAAYLAVVKVLLAAGADVECSLRNGSRPLYKAAQSGFLDILEVLLAAGAITGSSSDAVGGETPLMIAAMKGRTSCVKALINHGCDVDAVSALGSTALIGATAGKHHECVRLLMRKSSADAGIASTNPLNPFIAGKTPLEIAAIVGADAATLRELRRVCTVCGKTQGQIEGIILKCGKCLAAYYCSVECHTKDLAKHELVCEQMAAEETERAATAAVAKAAVAQAAKEAATAAAEAAKEAAAAAAKPHCLWCSKTSGEGGAELSKCSRCKTARYCSRECQKKDFSRHKTADKCKK
jgi:ankyrin repeat protein